ncbi:hypothetical protein IMG5_098890 [Ichthyophthirius multifiliis]|uniref:Uncharacterized protein n=1 Tax=Ichthyophthirius multifiliis TaxID=5932 RepID=G0QS23_ICHMU|nr:hypothetical protein IMG5_098890 [Ichthyophthirius multifiliis]EGR31965.1 hypothetical protein IMG5_098890 [Ichthyophthirius multifiliis]|eukprot:XP_004035451.1 hypothetical protein IMG5_098890 [Ichthyophthirius multifiliis]
MELNEKIEGERKKMEKEKAEIARLKSLKNVKINKFQIQKNQIFQQIAQEENKYNSIINNLQLQIQQVQIELEKYKKDPNIKGILKNSNLIYNNDIKNPQIQQDNDDDFEFKNKYLYSNKKMQNNQQQLIQIQEQVSQNSNEEQEKKSNRNQSLTNLSLSPPPPPINNINIEENQEKQQFKINQQPNNAFQSIKIYYNLQLYIYIYIYKYIYIYIYIYILQIIVYCLQQLTQPNKNKEEEEEEKTKQNISQYIEKYIQSKNINNNQDYQKNQHKTSEKYLTQYELDQKRQELEYKINLNENLYDKYIAMENYLQQQLIYKFQNLNATQQVELTELIQNLIDSWNFRNVSYEDRLTFINQLEYFQGNYDGMFNTLNTYINQLNEDIIHAQFIIDKMEQREQILQFPQYSNQDQNKSQIINENVKKIDLEILKLVQEYQQIVKKDFFWQGFKLEDLLEIEIYEQTEQISPKIQFQDLKQVIVEKFQKKMF